MPAPAINASPPSGHSSPRRRVQNGMLVIFKQCKEPASFWAQVRAGHGSSRSSDGLSLPRQGRGHTRHPGSGQEPHTAGCWRKRGEGINFRPWFIIIHHSAISRRRMERTAVQRFGVGTRCLHGEHGWEFGEHRELSTAPLSIAPGTLRPKTPGLRTFIWGQKPDPQRQVGKMLWKGLLMRGPKDVSS